MGDLVIREDDDGLAILSFNRPEVLNALSPNLFVEFREHIDALAQQQDEVGVIIITGKGKAFSAGNDIKAIQAGETVPTPQFQAETLEAMEALPQPIIAAVHSHCYTGALELALACDLMVAAESAKIADTHGRWAMTPIWGMSQRLPMRVGLLKAKEMMYSGRTISGAEAVEIGLANVCVPDESMMDTAIEMARSFLKNSWHTLRSDKWLVNQGLSYPLDEGLKFERDQSPGQGPDIAERLKNFGRK